MTGSKLWAITCYFPFDEPPGEKRRLAAYREFRRRLEVPLAAVELSREGRFDLGPDDADLLIQLAGGDLLWQKERLLNIALKALPASCDAVAWIDCDVVLARRDWPGAALRLLEEFPLGQPFRQLHFLRPGQPREPGPSETHRSAAYLLSAGGVPEEYFIRRGGMGMSLRCSAGMMWVIRREVLDRHGLYDAMILGGGDKAVFCAACGRWADYAASYQMSARQREHYRTWAEGFFRDVVGRIGYLEGDLLHLWHGDLASRHYADRYSGFDRFAFDPDTDLVPAPNGAWRWGPGKPELRAFVRRYFERRQGHVEDAARAVTA
ncbi:MAG: hypothetical protein KIT09_29040 [Bryobacteraceae bacterium]|nr:hypothetical protein [Bryobacteraceae bacterium]